MTEDIKPKAYYEPTELQSVSFCAYKYYLEKVKGVKPFESRLPLVKGTIGHQVLSGDPSDFDEIFNSGINYYSDEALAPPLRVDLDDIKKMREELWVSINNYLHVFKAKKYAVVDKEKKIRFTLPSGREIRGIIDLIFMTPDTPYGHVNIIDYKFGRLPSNAILNRNLQFGLYYLGCRKNGIQVNDMFWVSMNDFLEYKRKSKRGEMGDLKGQGFYLIKIIDKDIPYIIEQAEFAIKLIEANAWIQHSNYASQPCGFCEYANAGCKRFKIGTDGETI